MKKCLLICFFALIPGLVFSGITFNWMPRLGMSFTWDESDLMGSIPRFHPGYAGGADLELRFGIPLGLKTGLHLSQLVHSYDKRTADIEAGDYTPVDVHIRKELYGLELPVLGMLYVDIGDDFDIYGGFGAINSYVFFKTDISDDRDTGVINTDMVSIGRYFILFIIDAGVSVKVGPGKITAGGGFSWGRMSGALCGNVSTIRAYAGYLF